MHVQRDWKWRVRYSCVHRTLKRVRTKTRRPVAPRVQCYQTTPRIKYLLREGRDNGIPLGNQRVLERCASGIGRTRLTILWTCTRVAGESVCGKSAAANRETYARK